MSKLSRLVSTGFPRATVIPFALVGMFALSSIGAAQQDADADPVAAAAGNPQEALAQDALAQWPMQVSDNARTFLVYQPQIDRWENNRLEGRSAVSVRSEAGQQNFGVLYFTARTELDPASRMVIVRDAVVSKADFPALGGGLDDYLSVLRPQLAAKTWRIAQERLQSDVEIDRLARQSARQPLKNEPPRILYSERPAVLVPVDGNPVLRPVANTSLMRVTNTRALLLQDKANSTYFLYVSDHWMQAPGLEGPWLATPNPSPQLEQAKQVAMQQDQVDLLQADGADAGTAPVALSIFVTTAPTELLQTDGPPQYAPIERTQLLYVTNSPNKLFLDLRTQNYYALLSGRWYRTTSLGPGQWSYVEATSLPADFAMIPSDNPTESVRAAVPGTTQAREAVIANSVPQTAAVNRSEAQLQVAYDGNPVFQPIEGTVLQNAVNSQLPVIRVSEDAFYALSNGVWFVASSPFGPWAAAAYVPPVIYSIPPSSPLYYVTYVRIYDATPQVVYVGYTPGYVGSYVSSDNVVVYGTGWPYSPWIGSVWYGAPVTWGFGFSFCYSWWHPYPWYGWHRTAWGSPYPYAYRPWWGYYRPWWGPWHAPAYAHARPSFVAGGRNTLDGARPGSRNVGRIYDRWDHGSVAWRSAYPRPDRVQPGNAFAGRSAAHDGGRDYSRRDAPQFRGNAVNSPDRRAAPAAQNAPPVQGPWRGAPRHDEQRARLQPAPQQTQPRATGGNERRIIESRPNDRRVIERGMNDRRTFNDRPVTPMPERPRQNVEQIRPAPQQQWRQHIPQAAGVPVERAPAQVQRAQPSRNFFPPARIERPALASGGRNFERPQMPSARAPERSFSREPTRGGQGRGAQEHGGQDHGGGGHR